MKTINNKLKELRLRNNLKQGEVAIWLNMQCENRLSRWEHGTSMPSVSNLFRLAQLYRVLPHTLYPDLFREEDLSLERGVQHTIDIDQPVNSDIVQPGPR